LIEGAGRIALIAIERQQSQEALRTALAEIQRSETNLRKIIDTIPTIAWCNLPDGSNEFLNRRWHDYSGLTSEESSGWGWKSTIHPEDLPKVLDKWSELLASGEPGEIEGRMRRHDGGRDREREQQQQKGKGCRPAHVAAQPPGEAGERRHRRPTRGSNTV